MGAGQEWKLGKALQRSQFDKKFGKFRCPVSDIPYKDEYSSEKGELGISQMRLADVSKIAMGEDIDNTKRRTWSDRYVFVNLGDEEPDGCSEGLQDAFLSRNIMPQWILNLSPQINVQFYIGGRGTGAPLHYHTDALNYLAHGRKLWMVYPRRSATWAAVQALHGFATGAYNGTILKSANINPVDADDIRMSSLAGDHGA